MARPEAQDAHKVGGSSSIGGRARDAKIYTAKTLLLVPEELEEIVGRAYASMSVAYSYIARV
jgi:hypothetical protein